MTKVPPPVGITLASMYGVDYQEVTLKMAVLELICLTNYTHAIIIVCLIPQLRHDYSEAVQWSSNF